MSKKSNIISGAIEQQLTNEILNKNFVGELGSKAIIQREVVDYGELQTELTRVLEDIGRDIQNLSTAIPKGMDYMGSIAVHIYAAPVTRMVNYYNQLAVANCPEELVGPAISDLRNTAIEYYRPGRAQRKRSGF